MLVSVVVGWAGLLCSPRHNCRLDEVLGTHPLGPSNELRGCKARCFYGGALTVTVCAVVAALLVPGARLVLGATMVQRCTPCAQRPQAPGSVPGSGSVPAEERPDQTTGSPLTFRIHTYRLHVGDPLAAMLDYRLPCWALACMLGVNGH